MEIATFQQNIKHLLKEGRLTAAANDVYFKKLKDSESLQMVKEIALWWRAYLLENYCPLTAGLLKRDHLYDRAIASFYKHNNVSSFIEEAGQSFLGYMAKGTEGALVTALASFELALIRVKGGDQNTYSVAWSVNPYDILHALFSEGPLPEKDGDTYLTTISRELDGFFAVSVIAYN
ncbi:MAG: hypothetical protein AAFZ15_13280 [Bacteroidota bacterium]